MRARGVFVLVCVATASCLSFGDLSGGGGDADGGVDASIDGNAPLTDAGIPSDSPAFVDAAHDASFCSTVDATFCEDFDHGGSLDAYGWTVNTAPGLSTLAVVDAGDPFLAAQSDVFLDLDSSTVPPQIPAAIRHAISGAIAHVQYEFDFSIDRADPSKNLAYFGSFDLLTSAANVEVRLGITSTGDFLFSDISPNDGGTKVFQTLSAGLTIAPDVWHHAELDADFSVSPATTKLYIDSFLDQSGSITGADFGPGGLTVSAGITYAQIPTGAWTIRTDNIVVNAN